MESKFGTLKPRNFETKQPRNFETKKPKPSNQEAVFFSSKGIPSTPRHTDSHPCTRPPSWGTRGSLGDTSGRQVIWEPEGSAILSALPSLWRWSNTTCVSFSENLKVLCRAPAEACLRTHLRTMIVGNHMASYTQKATNIATKAKIKKWANHGYKMVFINIV